MPREGHDAALLFCNQLDVGISIHVPREGHDNIGADPDGVFYIFQSTCPARGTTIYMQIVDDFKSISIHVPREGHDSQAHYPTP